MLLSHKLGIWFINLSFSLQELAVCLNLKYQKHTFFNFCFQKGGTGPGGPNGPNGPNGE